MLQITPPPQELLTDLLNRTDLFAVETVKAEQGGPFGASIHIYDPTTGHLEQIGELAANAVLAKGIGSAHAENEAISPENVSALEKALAAYDPKTVQVIMSSSGQSCPACTAKEEILARHLIEKGLIAPKNFIVTYGATYKDTLEIAQFNDEPYKNDLSLPAGTGMIRKRSPFLGFALGVGMIPASVRQIFQWAAGPVAVVVSKDKKIIGVGLDLRADHHDLMATPEVNAIRLASTNAHLEGKDMPWNLGGATLYTSTDDIGPLAYAECQWANIRNWVVMKRGNDNLKTAETSRIPNCQLFNIVASKDETLSDAVTIIHIKDFKNLAQHQWQKQLMEKDDPSKVLYNGIDTNPSHGPK